MAIVLGIATTANRHNRVRVGRQCTPFAGGGHGFGGGGFAHHGLALAHGGFAGQGFAMNRAVSAMVVSRPIACAIRTTTRTAVTIRARALRSHLRSTVMSIRRALVICVIVFAAWGSAANAGPCAQGINRLQAQFDSKLEANAVAGPSARESTAATMNRQPTPQSIAAAESKLGEISPEKVQAFEAAIARARVADRVADPSACEQALADAQSALDQL
jgi:hypothetical protein